MLSVTFGVTFGNKHSYDDYSLILTEYDIGTPEARRYLAEVPGRNGILDMTGSLTPRITYGNRQLQFAFTWKSSPETYEAELQKIINDIHGQQLHVVLDTDQDHYFDAFLTVDSSTFSGKQKATVVITGDAYPYRLENTETVKTLTGSGTLACENDRMEVIPEITVTAETTIVFGTVSATLAAGTHKVADIELAEGDNELEITGSGTTTIRYRQGRL